MGDLPSFWRIEVWHPLAVHLPLIILLLAFFIKLWSYIRKFPFWDQAGNLFLIVGTIGAWAAVYTGNLADGIVSRQICDPTVLKDHETLANIVAWLFSLSVVLVIAGKFGFMRTFYHWSRLAVLFFMAVGSGFLIYTGHLGATLVYQQAAGVYQPSDDCSEFVVDE